MSEAQHVGETLTELLERITFENPDPRIQALKTRWEEWQRLEQEVFDRVCREQYEYRLEYHQIRETPNAEEEARREAALIRPMLQEELDQRLALIWQDVTRRVNAVLEDLKDAE